MTSSHPDQSQRQVSPSFFSGILLGFALAIYLAQKKPATFKKIQKFITSLISGIHQKPVVNPSTSASSAPKSKPRPRPRTFRRSK